MFFFIYYKVLQNDKVNYKICKTKVKVKSKIEIQKAKLKYKSEIQK